MSAHFSRNENVIAWQTDNEMNGEFSERHCAECQRHFAEFLREKYGDIAKLNAIWGTQFWSQTYWNFEQIPTPRERKPAWTNPAHHLDFFRFLSDTATRFQREQIEILRAANPRWWVTHNGLFQHLDYRGQFTRDLDVLGYDCYPFFDYDPARRAASQAFNLDRARAWSGSFIIPEQQSGPGGQPGYFHDNLDPGEMRRATFASIARGADSLLYFRWRTCRVGAEQYWCGILDHDNIPRRRYEETRQIGRELCAVGPEVLGTSVAVDVGVAHCDQAVLDGHNVYSLGLPSPHEIAETVHGAFYQRGFAVGCVHPADDLSRLKIYIVPHWTLFDPAWVANLERFVENGGLLVIGARTATRDMSNNIVPETPPGCLRALAGVTVEEYGKQNAPAQRPLDLASEGRESVRTDFWYEVLKLDSGAKPLAHWRGRHLDGQPAVSLARRGNGAVVYGGTYFSEAVVAHLLGEWIKLAQLKPLWPGIPENVEVVLREDNTKQLWFFLNHSDAETVIPNPPQGVNLLTSHAVDGELHLPQHGVAVVKIEK